MQRQRSSAVPVCVGFSSARGEMFAFEDGL
jgi:hypothetical protein